MTGRCWSASGRPWATAKRPDKPKNARKSARNFLFKDETVWYAIYTARFRSFRTHFTNERNGLIPMVIDIHTHTFPDRLAATTIPKLEQASHTRSFSDGTNAGLAASMARAGVNCSVVLPVATAPKQVVHVNDCSAQINAFPRQGSSPSAASTPTSPTTGASWPGWPVWA